MVTPMRKHVLVVLLTASITATTVLAAATSAAAPVSELPTVEDSIPAPVKALGQPAMQNFPGGIQMAVSASTDEAQAHVNQGLNHLHAGWEFEASRHFAAAMRADPDCLLAHWGMVMSLLNPTPETGMARNAASDRLLYLVDHGQGTELERGYAYGLIKYIQEGATGAAIAYRKIAGNFPNDLQAGVFAALFGRGGYDEVGDATPDQQAAEQRLLELIQQHPQSPLPLNALLLIRAEGPDLTASLALARQLSQMQPDYAPVQHLLGHYEWRCGHPTAAAAAFSRSTTLYQSWMKTQQVSVADCPEWVKAECYRVVALVSKGEFDRAYAAARQLAATPLAAARPAAPGTRCLMWDAITLPARILIHRGLRGNASEAANSLPKPEKLANFRNHCLAYWWIDGLRLALEAQRLIDAKDLTGARAVVNALTQHGESMAASQNAAAASGERSAWTRSFHALEVLASDVRGRLALAGPAPLQGTAYNWFSSAADRQQPAPMLFPPLILTPMAARLGDFFLTTNQSAAAIEAYQRALTACPNDINTLRGLQRAYQAAANQPAAAATAKQIADLSAE